ncbi:hypothetical protein IWQ62_006685, partial [Dispira parvispora]
LLTDYLKSIDHHGEVDESPMTSSRPGSPRSLGEEIGTQIQSLEPSPLLLADNQQGSTPLPKELAGNLSSNPEDHENLQETGLPEKHTYSSRFATSPVLPRRSKRLRNLSPSPTSEPSHHPVNLKSQELGDVMHTTLPESHSGPRDTDTQPS